MQKSDSYTQKKIILDPRIGRNACMYVPADRLSKSKCPLQDMYPTIHTPPKPRKAENESEERSRQRPQEAEIQWDSE